MNYELYRKARDYGLSRAEARRVLGAIQYANDEYEYSTSHDDAADAYSILVTERYGIPEYAVECFFTVGGITWDSVDALEHRESTPEYTTVHVAYLGQSEIEVQLNHGLTAREAEFVNRHADWYVSDAFGNRDLMYAMFPDNLHVAAFIDSEYADQLQE